LGRWRSRSAQTRQVVRDLGLDLLESALIKVDPVHLVDHDRDLMDAKEMQQVGVPARLVADALRGIDEESPDTITVQPREWEARRSEWGYGAIMAGGGGRSGSPCNQITRLFEMTVRQPDIRKFLAEIGFVSGTHQPVRPAGAYHRPESSQAKSLWSPNVPKSGEICPTFQRAFCEMAFPGSSPGAPANHCRLSRAFPSCQKSRDTSVG
jgi:hypothetical protein